MRYRLGRAAPRRRGRRSTTAGCWHGAGSASGWRGSPSYVALLTELAGGAQEAMAVPVAIETDKNLLVVALQAAGFTVYRDQPAGRCPLSGTAMARRARSPTPATPLVLADILRTDAHSAPAAAGGHRALAARSRRGPSAPGGRSGRCSRPRTGSGRCCMEFYPASPAGVPESAAQGAPRRSWPPRRPRSPRPAANTSRVVALLHRCGRRNDPRARRARS